MVATLIFFWNGLWNSIQLKFDLAENKLQLAASSNNRRRTQSQQINIVLPVSDTIGSMKSNGMFVSSDHDLFNSWKTNWEISFQEVKLSRIP